MPSRVRVVVAMPRLLFIIGWGLWNLSGPKLLADEGPTAMPPKKQGKSKPVCGDEPGHRHGPNCGTLGYGPPGFHEGFQGFGLKFHPGYGYGGQSLGVGPDGGYPSYGGPGYVHPGPCLNRFGKEKPFSYFGGPGFPTPDHPHFFGEVGPLVTDQPVIEIGEGAQEAGHGGGYGIYTGLLPYPESTFAPSTTAIGTAGSEAGVGTPVPPGPPLAPSPTAPPPSPPTTEIRATGMEAEPVVASDGRKGLKVTRIQAGGAAEEAGLRVGDEIRSANNYVTDKTGDLIWIAAHAAPDDILRVNIRSASDGRDRSMDVRLR
ncbi:PDZ domain-containing protein (plasmid) [Tundrisphaera lichenicola]|uniref:PDZ domain-containing protein n=1 Tax=Tundrisphaera lichenicola TaxID=2029860 RepID=UPI003EB7C06A